MIAPAKTFAPESLAVDAMIDMLDAGIHHLPIVDPAGTPLGVVTATDLMYLESRTPFALRRSIAHAASVDELVEAAAPPAADDREPHPGGRLAARRGPGHRAPVRHRDDAPDRAHHRRARPAARARGRGSRSASTARREATLASDQDNALAYADPGGPEVDAYFADVAGEVNVALARCGFGADNAEVLARNRVWRLSQSEWVRVFHDCLEKPRPQPSRPRGRGLRLPRCGRRPRDRAPAGRDRAAGPGPPRLHPPAGAHGHRLHAAHGVPRPPRRSVTTAAST